MTALEQLLEFSGVDVHGTHQKNEVTLCCPFCEMRGFSSDESYHLGLNTWNGKAHCFRCDWKAGNVLFTAKQLRSAFHLEFDLDERALRQQKNYRPKTKKNAPESVDLPEEYERLGADEDFVGRKVRQYLMRRGVSLLQIVRHRIGYCAAGKYAWRAMFPVLGRDGKIYGCVGRGITADQEPKYLNTPGIKMLWNTEREAGTAVVVEGVMDALRVETALLQVQGVAAVARLGSSITTVQMDQLREYDNVVIFPDFDRPGVAGAKEFAERAAEAGVKLSIVVPDRMNGKDPGSMTDEEILGHIRGAVKWSEDVGADTGANGFRMRMAGNRRKR